MNKQVRFKNILILFVGVCFPLLVIITIFLLIRFPIYPQLSGHHSTDLGIRWSDCGNVSMLGITFYREGYYYSQDEYEKVKKWYKQFGWSDFIIKGHDFGIVQQAGWMRGRWKFNMWKRVQYSDISGVVRIHNDSNIDFCWTVN